MKFTKFLALIIATFSLPMQAEEAWTSLFDGKSLAGWVTANGKAVKEGTWVVEDGILTRKKSGGDLFSEKIYGDFEFSWEWKISPKGNSGVKYRVEKFGFLHLGPEYQILDNAHPDGKKSKKRQAAALYDLKAINEAAKTKPVGEWNHSRLVVKGKHFQHFLNGELALEVTVGNGEWKKIHAASKFKSTENYAQNPTGKLMLQDHGDQVWYRNLKIREFAK